MATKHIVLVIVLILIVGSIAYVELSKPRVDVKKTSLVGTPGASTAGTDTGTSVDGMMADEKNASATDGDTMMDNDAMHDGNDAMGDTPLSLALQAARDARVQEKLTKYQPAVELVSPDAYINAAPFNLSQYVGKKVIIVDFWTYSCINCQRTLPYLTAWDAKYRDEGLLIVGVHTPEFDFEKELGNVQRAVDKYGVEYPVVLDNERRTWRAYENHYWPHKYLIDIDGFIVYDHIGEGGYDETEAIIRQLLNERKEALGLDMTMADTATVNVTAPEFAMIGTPELYLGYGHGDTSLGVKGTRDQASDYALPATLDRNQAYLSGTWTQRQEDALLDGPGGITLRYSAKDVHIVAAAEKPVTVQIIVDGQPTGDVIVGPHDLYTVVRGSGYGAHTLELRSTTGLQVYTFTFG